MVLVVLLKNNFRSLDATESVLTFDPNIVTSCTGTSFSLDFCFCVLMCAGMCWQGLLVSVA